MSFLDMYVLPRAGRPTITMTVGGLAKWGAPAAVERDGWGNTVYHDNCACLQNYKKVNILINKAFNFEHSEGARTKSTS